MPALLHAANLQEITEKRLFPAGGQGRPPRQGRIETTPQMDRCARRGNDSWNRASNSIRQIFAAPRYFPTQKLCAPPEGRFVCAWCNDQTQEWSDTVFGRDSAINRVRRLFSPHSFLARQKRMGLRSMPAQRADRGGRPYKVPRSGRGAAGARRASHVCNTSPGFVTITLQTPRAP